MSKDYGSWSLAALKAELKKRNAKGTGKKAILVQRLQDYDILFGDVVNNPETSYRMYSPNMSLFRDLNTDMTLPVLDAADMDMFCSIAEHGDKEHAANMYKENYLITFRIAAEGNYHFVTSICASEMRKNISYNILIKYEANTVIEAQCECAAGVGPHAQCKHVVAVLYGLIDFINNKNINIRTSCTSTLQTFHHPNQIYKGGPVKAEDLKLKDRDENYQRIVKFDPRPAQHGPPCQKKYVESFKNHCINFSALQKNPMPISQITTPANKRALYADHDYLSKTQEEQFLEDFLLTPEQQQILEQTTRHNNTKWKKERLTRLHSCKFGKICNVTENQEKKLGKSLLKNIEITSPAIKHGRKYEKKALLQFTRETGFRVKECGIIVHNKYQFLASTPDGLVGDDSVVEVKCPYSAANKTISPESVNYIELCEKSGQWRLKKKHEYFYQVQGQLLCTNRSVCYFCIFTLKDFYVIKIERDDIFINEMIEKLNNFYDKIFKDLFLCRYLYNEKF